MKLKRFLNLLFFSVLMTAPTFAEARSFLGGPIVTCTNNCTLCDLLKTANNIISFLTELSILLVVLGVVFGGVKMMTSGGDESKFKEGKKIVTSVLIGLLIVLAAWVFVDTAITTIANGQLGGPWNEIRCN